MRLRALGGVALLLAGCASPIRDGQRLYEEGDRLGALEAWRGVPEDSDSYARARAKIAGLEPEFESLVQGYKQSAAGYEKAGRLAEAVLDYRLALELQPNDAETLDYVQQLARRLAERRSELRAQYRESFDAGNLASARTRLADLHTLDPFDAALEADGRTLEAALDTAVEQRMDAGRSAFAAGDHSSAARSFRAVLELDPGNEAARGYLSYIATMRREREAAATIAAEGASDAEMRAEGFHQSALAADRRSEPYVAIRYEMRAIETIPEHEAARRHLAELRRRQAGEVEALVEAGRIAFREENLKAAIDLWQRALLVDPENERVIAYLGRASQQLENLERLRSSPGNQGG